MQWNECRIVVGLPGQGKTTLQRRMIQRHLLQTKGIVLAHDPLRQFTRDGCAWYPDVGAYRAAAASSAKSGTPFPRGASIGGLDSSEAVTELALELGARLNTADNVRVPILVPYDEGSLREGSGATWIGNLDNQFVVLRRHRGVGPIFNLQEPGQLMSRFYRMSTGVFLFRQTRTRAAKLNDWLYLEPGTLERGGLCELPDHHYLHVRVQHGIVREAL